MGWLKKGFMSLKAGTRRALSSEHWVQSKVSASCQVVSHNTSSGDGSVLLRIYPPSLDVTATNPMLPAAPSTPRLGGTCYRFLYIQKFLYVQYHNLQQHHCDSRHPSPTSDNLMLLIKAEFNFNQLMLDLRENSAHEEPVHQEQLIWGD